MTERLNAALEGRCRVARELGEGEMATGTADSSCYYRGSRGA